MKSLQGRIVGGFPIIEKPFIYLLFVLLISVSSFGISAPTLTIGEDGKLTGVTELNIAGALYDVEFVEGTCIDLFSGCDEASDFDLPNGASPSAQDASQALLEIIAGSAYENYPGGIFGCSIDTNNQCKIFTPTNVTSVVDFVQLTIRGATTNEVSSGWQTSRATDTSLSTESVYARWSPSTDEVPFAYVTNRSSNNVSVIRTSDNTVIATVSVGANPQGIAITPNGKFAYVTNLASDSVSVIQTSNNTVITTVPVGHGPRGIAFTPDGAYAYLANLLSNDVYVIRTIDNTVVSHVLLPQGPSEIAITPDGTFAYVTNSLSNSVSVIRTADNTVSAIIQVGSRPADIAITPNGVFAYVANRDTNTVSLIRTTDNTVVATTQIENSPYGIAITPNGEFAFATSGEFYPPGYVSIIRTIDNTVVTTVLVGTSPLNVAFTPDGAFAYNTNVNSNNVTVIRTSDNLVVDTIQVNSGPQAIAITPQAIANTPPTAIAGSDQSIRAGELVTLDGSGSFDDNTPSTSLDYSWSFSQVPNGSTTTLNNAASATPSFIADHVGNYIVELVVTDEAGIPSTPDQVVVGTSNLAPTAVTGPDQLVVVGSTVYLGGTGSSDPENDVLIFNWAFGSIPAGSSAVLSNGDTDSPSFVADVEGSYEVILNIFDNLGEGTPDSVDVVATTQDSYVEYQIVETSEIVAELSPAQVTTQGNQEAFNNFLNQAVVATRSDNDATAIDKLRKAITRTDGCVLRGTPDVNGPDRDWITDCAEQERIYQFLNTALEALLF